MSEFQNGNDLNREQQSSDAERPSGTAGSTFSYVYGNDGFVTEERKKKKSGKAPLITLIIVLLCICIGTTAFAVYTLRNSKKGNDYAGVQPPADITPTVNPLTDENGEAFESVGENYASSNTTYTPGTILTKQQAAAKVLPSVVCIQVYGKVSSGSIFGYTTTNERLITSGSGVISSTEGYIITNAHVVENATSVQVVLYSGQVVNASIVGADDITDIALLKIDPTGLSLQAAEFAASSSSVVADTVLAIGNPGGLTFSSSVTSGIISALNRPIQDSSTGYVMYCIQTDVSISPGNSGGPLVNLYGQVIGITSSKIVASGYDGLAFAIPFETASPIVDNLLKYGKVKDRATVNITFALPNSVFQTYGGYATTPSGLCVLSVTGEAEKAAGLDVYDIIGKIDEQEINSTADFTSYLLKKKPGDTVTLTVYKATVSNRTVSYADSPVTMQLTLSEANS